jgi:hypothetical protein
VAVILTNFLGKWQSSYSNDELQISYIFHNHFKWITIPRITLFRLGMMAIIPSYSGGRDQEDLSWKLAWAKKEIPFQLISLAWCTPILPALWRLRQKDPDPLGLFIHLPPPPQKSQDHQEQGKLSCQEKPWQLNVPCYPVTENDSEIKTEELCIKHIL